MKGNYRLLLMKWQKTNRVSIRNTGRTYLKLVQDISLKEETDGGEGMMKCEARLTMNRRSALAQRD